MSSCRIALIGLACLIAFPGISQSQTIQLGDSNWIAFFLQQQSVLEELQLAGDQIEKIKEINEELSAEMRNYGSQAMGARNDPDELERLRVESIKRFSRIGNGLDQVLLPHQKTRFNQLFLRFKLYADRSGPRIEHEFLSPKLDSLKLTEKQKSFIKQTAAEHNQQLKKLLAKHRQEIRELADTQQTEILKTLTPEQRKVFDELMGPSFSFEESMGTIGR